MEEEQSCLFLPMWLFGLGLIILSFIGCTNVAYSPINKEELLFHSCPEQGHGSCPICCDTLSENAKVAKVD